MPLETVIVVVFKTTFVRHPWGVGKIQEREGLSSSRCRSLPCPSPSDFESWYTTLCADMTNIFQVARTHRKRTPGNHEPSMLVPARRIMTLDVVESLAPTCLRFLRTSAPLYRSTLGYLYCVPDNPFQVGPSCAPHFDILRFLLPPPSFKATEVSSFLE